MSIGLSLEEEQDGALQRQLFWSGQMDKADAFMAAILEFPVRDCGEPLVQLAEALAGTDIEVLLSERSHALGLPRIYGLREGLITDFLGAARALNERNWVIKIEDGFRTCEMQKGLIQTEEIFDSVLRQVIKECKGRIPDSKFIFKRLSVLIATIPKIGTHMSGSAIDISILAREDGSEVDRGGPYLEMSELTPMHSSYVSAEAKRNRVEITNIMGRFGFVPYPFEFWHYNKGDAYDYYLRGGNTPAIYGAVDWDPMTGRVQPIKNPTEPLIAMDEMEVLVDESLERLELFRKI
jgi:zinc D-Ala-D-Ala dipeptidase